MHMVVPLASARHDRPSPQSLENRQVSALLARPLYYELAEIALASGETPPGVWSDGAFFAMDGAA